MQENDQHTDIEKLAVRVEQPAEPAAVRSGDMDNLKDGKPRRSFSHFFSRKPVLISLAALLVLVGGAAVLLSGSEDKPADQQAAVQPKLGVAVAVLDGTATYKSADGEWAALAQSTSLREGDYIATDAGGRVVLGFDDGSALRLDESTTVGLTSLTADDIRVEHVSGTAYSRVVPSERSYTVAVDGADYQALGTAFVTLNKPTDKGVQVVQSSVKAANETVAEGKQFFSEHNDMARKDKVTDIVIDELKSSGFMLWNLELDEKDDKFKEKLGVMAQLKQSAEQAVEEAEPTSSAGLKISAKNSDKATVLSWTVSGVDVAEGFKIVRSKKSSTPTYGKDEAAFVEKSARSYSWKSSTEGTFWYRICAYKPAQNDCVSYSNAVQMEAVYVAPEKVTRGTMTLTEESGQLVWNYTGKAVHGYKLVMSTNQDPSYPGDSALYAGSSTNHIPDLSGKPAGTYNFRVCAYTNGSESEKCVDYSNQVSLVKP